jgi:hypothetical protein
MKVKTLLVLGLIAVGLLAAQNARDIERYIRLRNM